LFHEGLESGPLFKSIPFHHPGKEAARSAKSLILQVIQRHVPECTSVHIMLHYII
jgi:hypothetical protein